MESHKWSMRRVKCTQTLLLAHWCVAVSWESPFVVRSKLHKNRDVITHKSEEISQPFGHCAINLSLRDATVVLDAYLFGPISLPSASLNLISTSSCTAIQSTNSHQPLNTDDFPLQKLPSLNQENTKIKIPKKTRNKQNTYNFTITLHN